MVMWIVLGSLIGVVVIFLVVTTTLDRRKNKKIVFEKKALSTKVNEAGTSVASQVSLIIKNNDEKLKTFVPAVGKTKMSDINKNARDSLKKIHLSSDYKLLKHVEGRNEIFDKNILPLIKNKSNNWEKRNVENKKFFVEYKTPPVVKTKKAKQTKRPQKRITPKEAEKIAARQQKIQAKMANKAKKGKK